MYICIGHHSEICTALATLLMHASALATRHVQHIQGPLDPVKGNEAPSDPFGPGVLQLPVEDGIITSSHHVIATPQQQGMGVFGFALLLRPPDEPPIRKAGG